MLSSTFHPYPLFHIYTRGKAGGGGAGFSCTFYGQQRSDLNTAERIVFLFVVVVVVVVCGRFFVFFFPPAAHTIFFPLV